MRSAENACDDEVCGSRNEARHRSGGGLRTQRSWRLYLNKKIYAKNLLKEAAVAPSLGNEWQEVSPNKEELASLQRRRTCKCQA